MKSNKDNDFCITAPTGSGKTLVYVIPIIQLLSKRINTLLRVIIILPSRDLVLQLYKTIKIFSDIFNLKVILNNNSRLQLSLDQQT